MPSISNWLTVLAAVSAPLVATAYSVIDTRAVATGASDAVAADPFVGDALVSDASLVSDEFASSGLDWAGEELSQGDEQEARGRALLGSRRKRGTSRASPRVPSKKRKSPPKKRSPSKKKSSKKKSPPKKKSSKKKSPPKKKSAKKKSSPKKAVARVGGVSRGTGKTIGAAKKAHGTFFSGMGSPTGGCGVPPGKAYDDKGRQLPFVALNTNSEFSSGSNCGRWIEITLKENCEGGGNSAYSICNGGRWVSDSMTGDKIHGYVMDSCADDNYWCQDDTFHLDISKQYLTAMGYVGQGRGKWNGRKVEWQYMTGVPTGWSMSQPKFMWKSGSKWIKNGKGFYASVIIYNTSNGIGGVQQKVGNSWVPIRPLQHLGNMWVLQKPGDAEYRRLNGGTGQHITIRVLDTSGDLYGAFKLKWMCGGDGACPSEVDAPSQRV